MIKYDIDGTTLFYVDKSGQKQAAGWYDGEKYKNFLDILQAQNDAISKNTQVVSNYLTALGNYQTNIDIGRPSGIPPSVPQQRVVDDLGGVTYVDFVPSLPIPKPLIVAGGGSTSLVSTPTTKSDMDIIKDMLTAIFKLLVSQKGN